LCKTGIHKIPILLHVSAVHISHNQGGHWLTKRVKKGRGLSLQTVGVKITEGTKNYKGVEQNRAEYRGADNSLARPGRKEATATEDFDVHISYL
jgi:hypothetical protein